MKRLFLIFIFSVLVFSYDIKEFVTCKDVENLTPINPTKVYDITKDKKVFAFAYFINIKEKN